MTEMIDSDRRPRVVLTPAGNDPVPPAAAGRHNPRQHSPSPRPVSKVVEHLLRRRRP